MFAALLELLPGHLLSQSLEELSGFETSLSLFNLAEISQLANVLLQKEVT